MARPARRTEDNEVYRSSSKRLLYDEDDDKGRSPNDEESPTTMRKKMKEAEEKNGSARAGADDGEPEKPREFKVALSRINQDASKLI